MGEEREGESARKRVAEEECVSDPVRCQSLQIFAGRFVQLAQKKALRRAERNSRKRRSGAGCETRSPAPVIWAAEGKSGRADPEQPSGSALCAGQF